jgi:hypothetical protein
MGGTHEQMKARAIEYFRRQFPEHGGFPLWVGARLLGCRYAEFQERFNVVRHEKLN